MEEKNVLITFKTKQFDGCLTTLTVMGEEKIVLDRTGAAESRLVIDKNKKHYCNYGTPYGSIQMGVQTGEIRSTLCDNGGDLFFKYVIDVDASLLGNYEVSINVKES